MLQTLAPSVELALHVVKLNISEVQHVSLWPNHGFKNEHTRTTARLKFDEQVLLMDSVPQFTRFQIKVIGDWKITIDFCF